MNRNWLLVYSGAFFEVLWVIGMKHAGNLWGWFGTAISIWLSFYFMIKAGRKLPVGTVYSVFVGLGTAGTVLCDILFFGEPFHIGKITLILALLTGVIGLKLVTKEKVSKEG